MNPVDSFKQECRIGRRIAQNRFLAQPCEHNHASGDGSFSEPLLEFYQRMKTGHWGIVVVETTATSSRQKCRERELVLTDEANNEQSWKKFFTEMKQQTNNLNPEGDTLWILQISGAGHMNLSGPPRALYNGQRELPHGPVLTTDEIETQLDEYVHATRLAYERGADGIDFKQCHRYFASLFLRPNNQREDDFGGSFENRTRFVKEYMTRARKEIRDNKFLWTTRINGWDGGFPGGFGMVGPAVREHMHTPNAKAWVRDTTEVKKFYELLNSLGFDLVNVSAGISVPPGRLNPTGYLHPNFFILQDLALHAKTYFRERQSGVVVASTGWSALGMDAFTIGSGYLDHGIDLIGFGRWQLCEPLLPKKVMDTPSGDPQDHISSNVTLCLACSKCYAGLRGQGPVKCAMYG